MANELVQGLLQSLLQPQQPQGPSPADIATAINSRNPVATMAAMQAPQLGQLFGQQFRGLIGAITGNKPLTANEAMAMATQQMTQADPKFLGTSVGLAQLAKAASSVGRTAEAAQLSMLAAQKKQEEDLLQKDEQERMLREKQINAQISASEAQAQAALANARTPEEIAAAIAASEALTAQRQAEVANMPEELKIRQAESESRRLEAQNRSEALQAQIEANKLAREGLDVATRKTMNDAEQEAIAQFNQAENMIRVADAWAANPPTPGFFGSLESAWKDWTGTQGGEDIMRADYTRIMNSGVLSSLPPGAASDKDIQIAMAGWPSKFTNAETLAKFLRGTAKLAAIASEQAQQKAKWIKDTGNLVGFAQNWNEYTKGDTYQQDLESKYGIKFEPPEQDISPEEAQRLLNQGASAPSPRAPRSQYNRGG